MQINYDNSAYLVYDFRTAPLTIPYRCTGNKRQLFVCVHVDRYMEPAKLHHVVSVTYNGVALANLQTADYPLGYTNRYTMLWSLTNAAQGLNNIVITFDAESKGVVVVTSYDGVEAIRASAKITKTETATPWSPIVLAVPSLVGDKIVDFLDMQHLYAPIVDPSQTQRYNKPPYVLGTTINFWAGSDKNAVGASTDMQWINGFSAYEAALMGASMIPSAVTGGGNIKFPIISNRRLR